MSAPPSHTDTDAMLFDDAAPMTAARALAVYEFMRGRGILPPVQPAWAEAAMPERRASLRGILDNYDALFLDGFGVLNTGGEVVPHADTLLADAAARGMPVLVVTNAGTRNVEEMAAKYRGLGLEIAPETIIPGRNALLDGIGGVAGDKTRPIGVVDGMVSMPLADDAHAPPASRDLRFTALDVLSDAGWGEVEDIAFLGAPVWDDAWQARLYDAAARGCRIHLANPDVTAPVPDGFTFEPGYWAAKILHAIPDARLYWYGKPHAAIFAAARARLDAMGESGKIAPGRIAPGKIAMVGDSLHTDILGGRAAGLETVLVLGHGLFRTGDVDVEAAMRAYGIIPGAVVETV